LLTGQTWSPTLQFDFLRIVQKSKFSLDILINQKRVFKDIADSEHANRESPTGTKRSHYFFV
jgi:hypothetical protein